MSSKACKSVGIVGAGIQGVCIGLQLLKKNIPATIFDPKDPGSMASYGNAGHFSPYAILQLNRPDVFRLFSTTDDISDTELAPPEPLCDLFRNTDFCQKR